MWSFFYKSLGPFALHTSDASFTDFISDSVESEFSKQDRKVPIKASPAPLELIILILGASMDCSL